MTSQDPFPATGQGNSKQRTSLTFGSVFAWGLDINLKFLICYLNMVEDPPILTKLNIRISPFPDFNDFIDVDNGDIQTKVNIYFHLRYVHCSLRPDRQTEFNASSSAFGKNHQN